MPDYAPGTPSWVELSSPDPDASAAFYRDVLGWSATSPAAPRPAATACSSATARASPA